MSKTFSKACNDRLRLDGIKRGFATMLHITWALSGPIHAQTDIDMAEYELNTLIMLAAEKTGDVMEFWVSVSFAVVVASCFISKKMNVKIFKIMGFLYALSSVFLASIYVGSALQANHYFDQLVNLGVDASHFSNAVGFTAILMAPLVFSMVLVQRSTTWHIVPQLRLLMMKAHNKKVKGRLRMDTLKRCFAARLPITLTLCA